MASLLVRRSSLPVSSLVRKNSSIQTLSKVKAPKARETEGYGAEFVGNGQQRHSSTTTRRWFGSSRPIDTNNGASRSQRQHSSHDEKIKQILTKVPAGGMDPQMVSLAHKTIAFMCQKNTEGAAAMAEQLLDRLAAELEQNRSTYLSSVSYSRIIRAWAGTKTKNSVFHAHSLLEKMQARHQAIPARHPAPDAHTYRAFLYACSLSEHKQAIPMAEELVRLVEKKSNEEETTTTAADGSSLVVPLADTNLYNALILVYANRSSVQYGAATAAEDCLMRLSQLSATGGPGPDTHSFNLVLKAWTHSSEDNGADRALEILKLLWKLKQDNHHVRPDSVSFGTVINGFARRKRPLEADAVFQHALEYFSTAKQKTDLTNCFNTVSLAWTKSRHAEAPERVERLIRDAYKLVKDPHSNITVAAPNMQMHTHCIEAFAHSGRPTGMDRADQLLRDMVYSFVNSNGIAPTVGTFDIVIHGWLRSERAENAARAEALLHLMVDLVMRKGKCAPAANHFTMCIMCWTESDSPEAIDKAFHLIETMEQLKLTNFYCYRVVINKLCHSRNPHNVLKAVQLLQRMEEYIGTQGIEKPFYAVGLYTLVVSSLAKVGTLEAAELALQTLRGMSKVLSPTTRTYTGVVNAFSWLSKENRACNERAVAVAVEMFDEMKQLDADPDNKVTLDRVVCSSVLDCLACSSNNTSGSQACRVLGIMIELHESGRKDMQPDSRCYDACLVALTRSRDPTDLARAINLLKALVTKHDEKAITHLPSPMGFQAVIKSCSSDSSLKEADEIARLMEYVAKNANDLKNTQ